MTRPTLTPGWTFTAAVTASAMALAVALTQAHHRLVMALGAGVIGVALLAALVCLVAAGTHTTAELDHTPTPNPISGTARDAEVAALEALLALPTDHPTQPRSEDHP